MMERMSPDHSGAGAFIDEILFSENFLQGVFVVGGEAQMEVSPPSLGLEEFTGKPADLEDEFIEDPEVGVRSLGLVEPVFL